MNYPIDLETLQKIMASVGVNNSIVINSKLFLELNPAQNLNWLPDLIFKVYQSKLTNYDHFGFYQNTDIYSDLHPLSSLEKVLNKRVKIQLKLKNFK